MNPVIICESPLIFLVNPCCSLQILVIPCESQQISMYPCKSQWFLGNYYASLQLLMNPAIPWDSSCIPTNLNESYNSLRFLMNSYEFSQIPTVFCKFPCTLVIPHKPCKSCDFLANPHDTMYPHKFLNMG